MAIATPRTTAVGRACIVAALLAGGCAAKDSEPRLAKVCQFQACVCAEKNVMFWQAAATVPVEWRANGEAGCPSGYGLRETGAAASP